MKKLTAGFLVVGSLTFASCAPKYTNATAKPAATLSCGEIKDELAQLASIRADAESKKGFSKQNVLWAIFFWPGAVVNEMDNRDVLAKVDARTQELVAAQTGKGCPAN